VSLKYRVEESWVYYEKPKTHKAESQKAKFLKKPNHKKKKNGQNAGGPSIARA
jgi:hypothetical protein